MVCACLDLTTLSLFVSVPVISTLLFLWIVRE